MKPSKPPFAIDDDDAVYDDDDDADYDDDHDDDHNDDHDDDHDDDLPALPIFPLPENRATVASAPAALR